MYVKLARGWEGFQVWTTYSPSHWVAIPWKKCKIMVLIKAVYCIDFFLSFTGIFFGMKSRGVKCCSLYRKRLQSPRRPIISIIHQPHHEYSWLYCRRPLCTIAPYFIDTFLWMENVVIDKFSWLLLCSIVFFWVSWGFFSLSLFFSSFRWEFISYRNLKMINVLLVESHLLRKCPFMLVM